MKKLMISAVSLTLLLTGCAVSEEDIQRELLKGLEGSENYDKYIELSEAGRLDEKGNYILSSESAEAASSEDTDVVVIPENSVRVTFADNQRLGVKYYYDSAHTKPVEGSVCWLQEGGCIYASEPVVKDAASSTYYFERFRVTRYDDKGKKLGELKCDDSVTGLVLQVAENIGCSELSVEPVGAYASRTLTLSDYCVNADGSKDEQASVWVVNNKNEYSTSHEISSIIPYSVICDYDTKNYFVVDAHPDHNINEVDGTVNFDIIEPSDGINDFSVELHRYISVPIESKNKFKYADISNKGNGVEIIISDKDKTDSGKKLTALPYTLQQLKYGNVLHIVVPSECKISCDQVKLKPQPVAKGYEYTITITEGMDNLRLVMENWANKKVNFDVVHTGLGYFHNIEDQLLKISVIKETADGKKSETYDYCYLSDDLNPLLVFNNGISMDECDRLEISLDEKFKDRPNVRFAISVNGANPVYFSRATENPYISLDYYEAENIKITPEKGYVFSYKDIDNGNLGVKYYVISNGSQHEIAEGEFIPEGVQVSVSVTDIPAGLRISGGAVKEGSTLGYVMVSDRTRCNDFVVNSVPDNQL